MTEEGPEEQQVGQLLARGLDDRGARVADEQAEDEEGEGDARGRGRDGCHRPVRGPGDVDLGEGDAAQAEAVGQGAERAGEAPGVVTRVQDLRKVKTSL